MAINFYTPEFYDFNNFSAHAVEFDGALYPTAEHARQALDEATSRTPVDELVFLFARRAAVGVEWFKTVNSGGATT